MSENIRDRSEELKKFEEVKFAPDTNNKKDDEKPENKKVTAWGVFKSIIEMILQFL